MNRYIIRPAVAPLPDLTGRVFNPDGEPFCRLPFAAIVCHPWGGDYRPEARACVGWDNVGLRVLLCAAQIMEQNGKMTIINANEEVLNVFALTGFDTLFTIV